MADDSLMERFADQARAKKKYRDLSNKEEKREHVLVDQTPLLLNLLHREILEEDYDAALTNLTKLVQSLGLEDKVNFDLD